MKGSLPDQGVDTLWSHDRVYDAPGGSGAPQEPAYPVSYRAMTPGLAGGSAPSTPATTNSMAGDAGDERKSARRTLVQARVSTKEFARWRSKATAAGVSSSELLRQAMARTGAWTPSSADVERARARDVERARTREIARIGGNVNQIARWANTHKGEADAGEVLVQLVAIERALRELVLSGSRKA